MPFTSNSLIFGSFFLLLLLPLRHLLLLVRRFMENESSQRAKLPPGPWKLPILGSIHHLPGEQTHRRFHSLAVKYGPLFHLKLGQVDFVVASSPESAEQVLGTHDQLLASRPTLVAVKAIGYDSSGIGFSPYGAHWRQLRKICTQELLSCKRVASFGFIREEEGERLVQEIREAAAGGSPVNLTEMLMSVTNRQITRAAFGKECASRQRFLSALKKTMKLLSLLRVADLFPSLSSLICMMDGSLLEMRRLLREMDGVLDEIIREHRAKRGRDHHDQLMQEDLVDVLLRILERGDLQIPLTIDIVKAVILDMLVAATESTSHTMCWVMSELICNPEIMHKVQSEVRGVLNEKTSIKESDINELKYLHNVIMEALRLHTPLPLLLPRTSEVSMELLGYKIPPKARVVVNAWAIARDPKIWQDPEKFWPERFDSCSKDFKGSSYMYFPFGAGQRICPGTTFALAGMKHFLARLLFHFNWKIPRGGSREEFDMEELFDGTMKRKHDLCLIAIPYDDALKASLAAAPQY